MLDESYLAYRFAASAYLARALGEAGWPVVLPAAAHAVYLDAGAALPHIPSGGLPGQSLACALYLLGGIRTCEIGDLMFGAELAPLRSKLPAMRIVEQAPSLRHFSVALAPEGALPAFVAP